VEREASGLPLETFEHGGFYPHLPAASAIGVSAAASAVSVTKMAIRRVFTALSFRFPGCPAQSDLHGSVHPAAVAALMHP